MSGTDAFVAKISSSIPFASFDARAKIDVEDQRHHGGGASHHCPHHEDAGFAHQQGQGDEFDLTATFTLGPGNNGIAPLTEAMTVQVGTFATTIPAGSFKQHKGRFVEGHGAELTGTKNPVTVSVTIGDNSGSKAITAKFK